MSEDEFTWITEIQLVDYDKNWPQKYQEEAEILQDLLEDTVVSINHVGSTAVPGLNAKPVVDLMVDVTDIEEVRSMNEEFQKAGYEILGENGIPGRHFITRNSEGERTHDIHIFQTGHKEIEQMILFRDRMLENPLEAEAYSELKKELATQYHDDPIRYTQGKTDFILSAIAAQREKTVRNDS